MELTDSVKTLLIETAKQLKGAARRRFMAQTVKELGAGGQSRANKELGWDRDTVRKGVRELETGITCVDNYKGRGRKKSENHLPHLLADIQSIVDSQSQTDPTFKSNRLYTRLSAEEVRKQLILQKNYRSEELPTTETIRRKLNDLGYYPQKVKKSKPQKKIPETDEIFERMEVINEESLLCPDTLEISMDGKAAVNIGPFSRKGKTRIPTLACDHDFNSNSKVIPYGIFLPQSDDLFLYFIKSQVTSDCIVDILEEWWQEFGSRFGECKTLLIKQDNGPENHSRRTQFMKRIVEFVETYKINVRLAYYPPYHSKYNPIERTWAVLENHWNGTILEDIKTALQWAETMTWKGNNPVVKLVEKTYKTGVQLTSKAMKELETKLTRFINIEPENQYNLGKWFVDIFYSTP
ncbi:ISAzo13 family transposase [Laspinema palackyanum]|uniref:ISAzo13 family transposase n=1 Tax=Laspinema palackyanum TaxID=3231601 RepID=UPI00345C82B5|nr:ISAzo13 family transposase [Laspinema sp. D2c]